MCTEFLVSSWIDECILHFRAYPLTLSPSKCGHTFCAICILKWFFSHLHRECGQWHESLECPICRTQLPSTPDTTPRSIKTCPFTPNRLADSIITDLVNSLISASDDLKKSPRGKARRTGRTTDGSDAGVVAWIQDGASRQDWLQRLKYVSLILVQCPLGAQLPSCRRGRDETQNLVNRWRSLESDNFVAIHDRLNS